MSTAKQKGTAFETAVVRYLAEHGFPHAERRALAGVLDKGDVTGLPGWVLELKAHRAIELGAFMAEAEREARNARCDDFACIIKRRQHNVRDAYAVVPLWLFTNLVRSYEDAAATPPHPRHLVEL